jgi:Tfp pilus assembly protein PilF
MERARNVNETVVVAKHEETPAPPALPAGEDALGLAAACIEKGDVSGAAEQLRKHLRAHPRQIMIRAYLAELLLKMKDLPEAQHQFDCFIAEAQGAKGPAHKHVLHCHTRLMEIAQDRDDAYGEHLHRGIGMVLLARQLEAGIGSEDVEPGFRERLLCKAVAELNRARKLRPDEPRPHCYLVEVFTKLDQPRSADKASQTAKSLAALLPLPPNELKALYGR